MSKFALCLHHPREPAIDYRQGPHINTVRDPRDASASWTPTGVVLEGSGRASRHDVARVEAVATLVANRLHISGPAPEVGRMPPRVGRRPGPAPEVGRMPPRVGRRPDPAPEVGRMPPRVGRRPDPAPEVGRMPAHVSRA